MNDPAVMVAAAALLVKSGERLVSNGKYEIVMHIQFTSTANEDGAALIVFSAQDLVLSEAAQRVDDASGGALRKAARAARFAGDLGKVVELLGIAGTEAQKVLLVGTGPQGRGNPAGFERIGAVKAATFHFLNPFFGVAVAAVLLGEPMGRYDVIGVVIVTLGILAVQRSRAALR